MQWGVQLFVAGVSGLPGVEGGEARMAGASLAGVCGCSGGGGRPVSPGLELCLLVGVWRPQGGEWKGTGGGRSAGLVCGMLVFVSACSRLNAWPPGGGWLSVRISQF